MWGISCKGQVQLVLVNRIMVVWFLFTLAVTKFRAGSVSVSELVRLDRN